QALAQIPQDRLCVVSPSRWLDTLVGKSHLGWSRRQVIHNGIDLTAFAPRPLSEARHAMGLPAQGLLLAAVAGNWDNPYKGGDLLLEVAKAMKERQLGQAAVAGRMGPPRRAALLAPGAILHEGLQGPAVVREVFSACDAALVLSKQENLPYVVSEALACGCPPIATSI